MHRSLIAEEGLELACELEREAEQLSLAFTLRARELAPAWLHWGLARDGGAWQAPPQSLWPADTRPFDAHAVQSLFRRAGDDTLHLRLRVPATWDGWQLRFVLFLEGSPRWLNNGGRDYSLDLDVRPRQSPRAALGGGPAVQAATLARDRELAFVVDEVADGRWRVELATDLAGPVVARWGLVERGRRWTLPPRGCWPAASVPVDGVALESPFEHRAGLGRLTLELDAATARGLAFVLRREGQWFKHGGADFFLRLGGADEAEPELPPHAPPQLAAAIIEAETGRGSWTLMHRFDLCHELLSRLPSDEPTRSQSLAALYVWLRFSALRQLDWQRNYNTKPRELAHAQDRLTRQLTTLYGKDHSSREMVRLMMATLGHGVEGQRVRDEILEIMHRHRIKEVTGHFMEEWHQKLHNNTTYDDVVICEAYLAFLRSNGDRELFYNYLSARGVTRARLESYERPIVTPPDFRHELKEALLHDFSRYLVTLKRVHLGTDLGVAFERASAAVPAELRAELSLLLQSGGRDVVGSCRRLVLARHDLRPLLDGGADARDLLFLDLALDERLRVLVEAARREVDTLGDWLQLSWAAAENVALSFDDDELQRCAKHLRQLARSREPDTDAARQLYAVRERTSRALAGLSDRLHATLQPWARLFGEAFDAARFTIDLFAEEVVRGRAPFALSAALRGLASPLRVAAALGAWEVVSPGKATGWLRRLPALRDAMERPPTEPTVALCARVDGDEEIPTSVVAVITAASVDLVSHVAVRARNAAVLLVTAHDAPALAQLEALEGQRLRLSVSADLALGWQPAGDDEAEGRVAASANAPLPRAPTWGAAASERWTVDEEAFDPTVVGAKARNLRRLRETLAAEEVAIPRGFALPFGCCERALARCPALQAEHDALIVALDAADHEGQRALFSALRQLVLTIEPPAELAGELAAAAGRASLPWAAESWPTAWERIKTVWASKWNERAARARRARGMPDASLSMAVLVQQLVPADLAFVLHTVDPRSGDRRKLYGEVVLGLGETLVGNHPGRALAFVADKESQQLEVLAYPSKSYALRGGGLIFRSDSSGEDLAGYAGAGLYDSVPLASWERAAIDYLADPWLADPDARTRLLQRLVALGVSIEQRFGAAQDVEGAVYKSRYHVVQTRPQVGLDERA